MRRPPGPRSSKRRRAASRRVSRVVVELGTTAAYGLTPGNNKVMLPLMPTKSTTHIDTPSGRPAGLLLGLTGALLALLILNLAVFDDLRIDPSAGVVETFTKPQHLSSLLAVLILAALVAFKHRSAARVAVVVAWIEIAAFAFFHVIPVKVGPSKPYWGAGMGDALQWVGLLTIIAVSAAIVRVVGRSSNGTVTPAAASLPS